MRHYLLFTLLSAIKCYSLYSGFAAVLWMCSVWPRGSTAWWPAPPPSISTSTHRWEKRENQEPNGWGKLYAYYSRQRAMPATAEASTWSTPSCPADTSDVIINWSKWYLILNTEIQGISVQIDLHSKVWVFILCEQTCIWSTGYRVSFARLWNDS